jgi:hypothetical protein
MITYKLRQNIAVPVVKLTLRTTRLLVFENSIGLRGFIGNLFLEDNLFHNHGNNDLVYSYPRVQYKIIDGNAEIIGIAEGVDAVKSISPFENITIGHEQIRVENIDLQESQSTIGITESQQSYSFLTPWLALNEKNYEKYQKLGNWAKRKELLEKILIGNIISMSKSLGYTVPEPIKANIGKLEEVPTSLKGTPMLGFLGTLSVNFEIPDYWGIGKSVSRGFGTIMRCRCQ